MNWQTKIDAADRMITKYGQKVVWRKPGKTTNVNQPWKTTAAANVDKLVSVAFLKPNSGLANALVHLIKGTDVTSGAPRGLLSAKNGFAPEITDLVIRNGETLVLKAINPVQPADSVIYYEVEFS